MQPERDIVARASSSAGSSAGALSAYVSRACGHLWLDERVLHQGYRFYAWMNDEIPHFFNKRLKVGKHEVAITVQAGLSLDGDDPFESCESHKDARAMLEAGEFEATLWSARITVDGMNYAVSEVADPVFIGRNTAVFTAIADELVALGIIHGHACPLCTDEV